MSTGNYQGDSIKDARVIQEYEQLIELAQSATETIDIMRREIDKDRITSFLGILVSYVLMIAAFAVIFRLKKPPLFLVNSLNDVLALFGAALSAVLAIVSFYIVFVRTRRARYQRVALLTESEIHQRLLSLVDEQKKRVESTVSLSPIALATLEIKVMRLQRKHISPSKNLLDLF